MSSSRSLGILADLPRPSRYLLGGKRVSLACHPHIAFDRGEAYTEVAGSLRFGYPAFEGFDYLCAKIFRIGSHSSMIASGSMLLTDAVSSS
jgi:hypothetical protein